PALIDPVEWGQAQSLILQARRLWSGRSRAEYLLSGLLVCGRCGMSMSGFLGTDWGVKRRKYTCRRSGGTTDRTWCGQALAAEPLEEAVWARLMTWLADPDALWESLNVQAEPPAQERELQAVDAALEQAERGRKGLLAALEQGLLPVEEAAASLGRVKARSAELAARRQELEAARLGQMQPDRAHCHGWVTARLQQLREGRCDAPDRRRLVREVVGRVEVDGRRATVYARWPGAFAEDYSGRN
ncbi:MAG TPA: zinc ribbon domain-containing protein, partial [Symbiobacteriaceae bacterium]|nr:zinc ribbon domain-containing protein [Symbiobacteriaceae bacterium]